MRASLVAAAAASALLLTLATVAAFACTPNYVPILSCDWTSLPVFIFGLFSGLVYFLVSCNWMSIDTNDCPSGVTVDAWSPLSLLHL